MSETRVIKRYANRKLYDTQRSRYVTLEQIADIIRAGQDVRIVDNNSKDDLTAVTLAQIIFEQEKKQPAFLPLSTMKNIIQSGGASLQEIASQAGAKVRSVFRRGDENHEDPANSDAVASEAALATEETASHAPSVHLLREFLERSQATFDEWQKRVDERIRQVVETLAPWTVLEKEVSDLHQRLADLEKKLDETARVEHEDRLARSS
jgi:polyhydroxyalkanoate synthesis repressor PhaR